VRRTTTAFALLAALAIAGCSGGGSATTGAAPPQGTAAEGLQVGLVTDARGLGDRGFNQAAADALDKASKELGVTTQVAETKADSDYIPALQGLAEQGTDVVFAVGALLNDAVAKTAPLYPNTKFVLIDSTVENPPKNLQSLTFRSEEAGYLAGYLAALTTKTGTISAVGGESIPEVDRYIGGYRAGANAANPDVEVRVDYAGSFVEPKKCRATALDQIERGSDVVFQVAGDCGPGALAAAKARKVWAIGSESDQAYAGPFVLTSAVKKIEGAVYKTIQLAQAGKLAGGSATVFGVAEDGVGLGATSPDAPADAVEKAKAQAEKLASGDVHVPGSQGR
jgi:basic membrane protein A and related proteins